MSLVERMRDSRKSPLVLKIKLIGVRSSRPKVLLFFFEGADDIPVYEEWLSRINRELSFEAIHGSGKEQVLALRNLLEGDEIRKGVYFFVDSDFDEPEAPDDHTFVLDSYSVENDLVVRNVVESLLRDEFRCAGQPDQRDAVLEVFDHIKEKFFRSIYELNEMLFIARRERARVTRRPDKITDIVSITLRDVEQLIADFSEAFECSLVIDEKRRRELAEEFSRLPPNKSMKGKYALQFLRAWLRTLLQDRKSPHPRLFREGMPGLPGSPENSSLRRFASAAPIPAGLDVFASRAVQEIF